MVATRDLKRLCEAGLLVPVGDKRGRHYVGSDTLIAIKRRMSETRRVQDPYELVHRSEEPLLL